MTPHSLFVLLNKTLAERTRQDVLWGAQHQPALLWANILTEEVGEALDAYITYRRTRAWNDATELYTELIQVAAVAVALIEHLDHGCELLKLPAVRPKTAPSLLAILDDLRLRTFDVLVSEANNNVSHALSLGARNGRLTKAFLQLHEGRPQPADVSLRDLALDVAVNAFVIIERDLPAALSHTAA